MQAKLPEFLQKLGVNYSLGPYETCPWSSSDSATGKTCSAEVRMNPDGDEVEAEIQIFYDNPAPGQNSIEQILWLRAKPHINSWLVDMLRIRRADWNNKIYGWEEKCCNFFRACVTEIEQGKIPDIDALLEREMSEKERFGGTKGGGAGKAPKIRPQQLLNMKQGGF